MKNISSNTVFTKNLLDCSDRERGLRLSLFQNKCFDGRSIVFRRGEVAVRNLDAFEFDNKLSSFKVRNRKNCAEVTLVLFEHRNYQGRFRVYRGNREVASISGFNNKTSSFLLVASRLSTDKIIQIQEERRVPDGVLEISNS